MVIGDRGCHITKAEIDGKEVEKSKRISELGRGVFYELPDTSLFVQIGDVEEGGRPARHPP